MTFKPGDIVTRINNGYGNVHVGQIVEVERAWNDSISLKGDSTFTYDSSQFVLANPVSPTCQDPVRKPAGKFEIGQWVTRRLRDFQEVKVGGRYRIRDYHGSALVLANRAGTHLYGSYDPRYFELDASDVQPVDQHDPNGIDQHAPGAKLDAGKLRPALVLGGFASAVQAMVKVGSDGARKYTDNGWKTVPDGKARYEDALLRHLLAHLGGEELDPESGSPHISHCMWNAAAIYELNKGNQNV